jgi:hypothetical protein
MLHRSATKTLDSLTDMTFAESSTNVLHHPVTNAKLFTLAQHANAHCIHCASVSKKPSISRSDHNDYNAHLTRVASYLNQADTSAKNSSSQTFIPLVFMQLACLCPDCVPYSSSVPTKQPKVSRANGEDSSAAILCSAQIY